jgi:hypothetical protein
MTSYIRFVFDSIFFQNVLMSAILEIHPFSSSLLLRNLKGILMWFYITVESHIKSFWSGLYHLWSHLLSFSCNGDFDYDAESLLGLFDVSTLGPCV